MKSRKSLYHRRRFPPEIIRQAVWLYYRFCLSDRDVEDLLAERGIKVSYETVRRWCIQFGPIDADTACFFIRIYRYELDDLREDDRESIRSSLRSMPVAVKTYKGFADDFEHILTRV